MNCIYRTHIGEQIMENVQTIYLNIVICIMFIEKTYLVVYLEKRYLHDLRAMLNIEVINN